MTEIKSGVYQIRNVINNKRYIGSTVNFKTRWKGHRKALIEGTHHSFRLQNAWNKDSEKSFVFETIACLERGNKTYLEFRPFLLAQEQHYKDLYKSYDRKYGYDICPKAESCLGVKHSKEYGQQIRDRMIGVSKSEETKKRISETLKGRKNPGRTFSDKGKKNISLARIKQFENKENHPRFGKKLSEETKKQISAKLKAKHLIPWMKGRKHSEDVLKKMRKPRSEQSKINIKNGCIKRKRKAKLNENNR